MYEVIYHNAQFDKVMTNFEPVVLNLLQDKIILHSLIVRNMLEITKVLNTPLCHNLFLNMNHMTYIYAH